MLKEKTPGRALPRGPRSPSPQSESSRLVADSSQPIGLVPGQCVESSQSIVDRPVAGAGPGDITTATNRIAGPSATATRRRPVDLTALAAVFPQDGARQFAVDAVTISCSPIPGSVKPPFHVDREAVAILQARGKLKFIKDGLVTIQRPGFTVTLDIERGTWLRAELRTNIMRRVRDKLCKAGLYTRPSRSREEAGDNFIQLSLLSPSVSIHAWAIKELYEVLAEARDCYRVLVGRLFPGVELKQEQIHVAISSIELPWDVPSRVARAAPILWRQAWCFTFPTNALNLGVFKGDGEVRFHDDAGGVGPGRALRATMSGGSSCILYPKDDQIRFELRCQNDRAGRVLGRAIRSDTVAHLDADLQKIAAPAYKALLATQESLQCKSVVDFPALFEGFASAGSKPGKIRQILAAFIAGLPFHNVGERHSKELRRLKEKGAVRYVGRGCWAPTPSLHRTLMLLQRLSLCAEEAA